MEDIELHGGTVSHVSTTGSDGHLLVTDIDE